MPLTLRPTGLSSPAYADKLDYVVCEDGKVIGRLYEDVTAPRSSLVLVHHGVRRPQAADEQARRRQNGSRCFSGKAA
jgi:hypothetical protein